jgi:hypothetical protein
VAHDASAVDHERDPTGKEAEPLRRPVALAHGAIGVAQQGERQPQPGGEAPMGIGPTIPVSPRP